MMQEEKRLIEELVERYKDAVHTQEKEQFYSLWSGRKPCMLISITNRFDGVESIYRDFLLERIKKAYSSIRLVSEALDVRFLDSTLAAAVFQYHTECILRESGEPYGIKGMETQLLMKEDGNWKLVHIHYSKG